MTYRFYFFVEKLPKLFTFSGSIKKIYLVEFNNLKKKRFMACRKFYQINFPETFMWSAIVNDACMQKNQDRSPSKLSS